MIITVVGTRAVEFEKRIMLRDVIRHIDSIVDDVLWRSGGARGTDESVEVYGKHTEISLPYINFNGKQAGGAYYTIASTGLTTTAIRVASIVWANGDNFKWVNGDIVGVPINRWHELSYVVKNLHSRNVFEVLGKKLDLKSDFLLCYAKPTMRGVKGGTDTAFRLAKSLKIPTLNLWTDGVAEAILKTKNLKELTALFRTGI